MSRRTLTMTDALHDYLVAATLREPDVLQRLRRETLTLDGPSRMQISPEQGQFMALLARLIGARRVLEIGTFTGYSALAVALALPSDGSVVACDVNEEWTAIARRYWADAGMADRIDLRLAPALETLAALESAGEAGGFDMAFIDADKPNYPAYYEHCLNLVRPGGLILVDNVLWSGAVADPAQTDPSTATLRALNETMRDDSRIDFSLVPIGDGLSLARRREA